ncbi:nucleotide-binding alpha-beta plait domain-containing protein [Tanacetum coccineum]
MGSSKSNASQVDDLHHPDPLPSTIAAAAGKREAVGENVVISKKQKIGIANNLQACTEIKLNSSYDVNTCQHKFVLKHRIVAIAGLDYIPIPMHYQNQIPVEVPPSMQSATTAASDRKNSGISNEPKDVDIDIDSSNKEDDQHLRTSVEVSIATTTLDANRECISNEYEKVAGDDSSRHLESPLKSLETPITSQGTRSTIVLLDNLSLSTTEEDVKFFFKNVGEVAQVHFDIKDDHFAGHGHVEFTTAEAAHELTVGPWAGAQWSLSRFKHNEKATQEDSRATLTIVQVKDIVKEVEDYLKTYKYG